MVIWISKRRLFSITSKQYFDFKFCCYWKIGQRAFFDVLTDNILKFWTVVKNWEIAWESAYKTLLGCIVRFKGTNFCLFFVEQCYFLLNSKIKKIVSDWGLNCEFFNPALFYWFFSKFIINHLQKIYNKENELKKKRI